MSTGDLRDWVDFRQVWHGQFEMEIPIPPDHQVFSLLEDSGGVVDMNVDGSIAAVNYDHVCPANTVEFLNRSCIVMAQGNITIIKFAGLAGGLAKGLRIQTIDSDGTTVLNEYTNKFTVKANYHFGLLAGPDVPIENAAGEDALIVRWTMEKIGSPILLVEGQSFRVIVQDDLSDISEFLWMIQGRSFADGIFND